MNVPSTILTLLMGIGLTLISLWAGQNYHLLLPVSATDVSSEVDRLFGAMLTIAAGLFVLVQGALIYAIVRFRQKPGDDTDGPPIRGNIPLEILWTAIPAIICLAIAVFSFDIYNSMGGLDPMASGAGSGMAHHHHGKNLAIAAPLDGSDNGALPAATQVALGLGAAPESQGKPPDLEVNVQGLQYAWIFNYPSLNGTVAGELHVPVGKDVQLNIAAMDVLHAFWIPQFRIKQDAIPGQPTQLRFRATKAGNYPIVCAELCGSFHGAMRTTILVQTPEEYDQWVASVMPAPESGETAANPAPALVATATRDLTDTEYLQSYSDRLGIEAQAIAQLTTPAAAQP
ncbi:MAG: cytochrome c oxidase subunit II [Oscillatoriales cyanobacterium]|nr:MAG: cytochrome c oxidase subunit II [Oscillatoriales cyanobacterium]